MLLVLAAALRFATLDLQSFSDDELFTAWLVDMPFGEMLSTISDSEATPPLFYVAEWIFSRALGFGEVGMRILPAAAGVVTVAVVYAAGCAGVSRRAGLAAGAFAAVNPFLIWYSQEARAYSLLILFAALSVWSLTRFSRTQERRFLAGWAVVAVAAMATHYFALFVIAPQALWLLVSGSGALRPRAMSLIGPVLAGLALLPLALHQRATVSDPGGLGESDLLERAAAVPKNFLVGFSIPAEAIASLVAAGLALVALLLARRAEGPGRPFVGAMGALAACGVGLPLLLSVVGLDYLTSRNVVAALVPVCLVLGCGFAAGRVGHIALGATVVLSVAVVSGVAAGPEYQRRDWRGAAQALGPPDGARLLIFSPPFSNPGPFGVYFGTNSRLLGDGPLRATEVAVVALARNRGFGPGPPAPPTGPIAAAPPGFRTAESRTTSTYRIVRYRSPRPRAISPPDLAALVPPGGPAVFVRQDARQ